MTSSSVHTDSPSTQGEMAFNSTISSLTELLSSGGSSGNGVALWSLNQNVYRNPFSIYLLDVACADLIFLCCHMVAIIPESSQDQSNFPEFVHISSTMSRFFCYIVGSSLSAAISTEQCSATLFPAWYSCRRPRYSTTCVCALIWVLCSLSDSSSSGACTQFFGAPSYHSCDMSWSVVAVLSAASCCTMCVTSSLSSSRVERGPERHQPRGFPTSVSSAVSLFLFCGSPFGIFWSSKNSSWHIPLYFYHFSFFMASVHSAAKPAIYFFLGSTPGQRFREPLRSVLQRALGDEAESGAGREASQGGLVDMTV